MLTNDRFEQWLRTACFQQPTPEAYDLAKCAWKEAERQAARPQADHHITLESGGSNESGWIQPTCTCGWTGRKEYAHNDWQHTNVREQTEQHLRGCSHVRP